MHTQLPKLTNCLPTYIHTYIHTYTHTHTHTHICTQMHACTHPHTHTHTHSYLPNYLLSKQLTDWLTSNYLTINSRVLLEKLTVLNIPHTLMESKSHYNLQDCLQLVHILKQMNSNHTLPPWYYPPFCVFQVTSFLQVFPPKPHILLSHECHMPNPLHPIWCNHPDNIWQAVQIMKLLLLMPPS